MPKTFLPYGFLFLSALGFLDATYLTVLHYAHFIPPCTIMHGCEQVLTSSYAVYFGFPTALFGVLYYATIFLGTLVYLETKNKKLLRSLSLFTFVGLGVSLWFLYLQMFIIQRFCQFCLFSFLTAALLCITGLFILRPYSGLVAKSSQ